MKPVYFFLLLWLVTGAMAIGQETETKTRQPATAQPAEDDTAQPAAHGTAQPAEDDTAQPTADDTAQPAADETAQPAADETKAAPMKEDEQPAETAPADPPLQIQQAWVDALNWRSIGPASMGGRIVDLAVVESDPATFYVATASGGLFKTTNNGTTFSPIFEKQKTVSIGDICVSPSDPNILWVGTGEHNARNSVSWGDGVYKSTDGGRTWQHMGLDKSFQIGRIAIHPTNPNIVYVGALGRLWGPSKQRGVYKTSDGGKSWQRALFVDKQTGCVDIAMHPRDPDTLIVAMYERQRDGFDSNDPAKRWGPGSGMYKTSDGGENWRKLDKGLPQAELGRIGICYYRDNPSTVYAIVESEKIGTGPATAYMGIQGSASRTSVLQSVVENGPAAKAGLEAGDRVLEVDGEKVESYNDLIVRIRAHKPDEKSQIKFRRGDDEKTVEITWGKRGGDAAQRPYTAYLGGQRANALKEQGEKGVDTGGIYKSTDGGESWTRINSLNPRPFYYSQIHIDPRDDRYQYVLGVSFHLSTNGGAEYRTGARSVHSDHHAMWIDPRDGRHMILGCDGGLYVTYDRGATWDFHNIMDIGQFYDVGVDTRSPFWVYGGLQDNGSWGGPTRKRGTAGPANADWLRIGGGDGFVCRVDPHDPALVYYESQGGNMGRLNVETGERARIRPRAPQGTRYRFNWKTPFMLSHHNSKIFYCAGNYVFRSLDRGNSPQKISPEISRTDRGSATAIAESPRDPNLLYVGTDDGALWVTRDGGHEWTDITKNVGLPDYFWVSTIETSRFETGRAYVAFDGHRSNNDDPHLYVTEDYGQSWTSLNGNLPTGSTRVLREDVSNANLLYAGTEFALHASLDRGRNWTCINNNLPTVAIHEIAVHPTAGEIVAATHGRSLWLLDVTPLRQMNPQIAVSGGYLFAPREGVLWAGALRRSNSGNRYFAGENGRFGSALYYYLAKDADNVSLEIRDIKGNTVRTLQPDKTAGLHRVTWDLRGQAPRPTGAELGRGMPGTAQGAPPAGRPPVGRGRRSRARGADQSGAERQVGQPARPSPDDQAERPPAPRQSGGGRANRDRFFQGLDQNKDGVVTESEIPEGRFGQTVKQIIERADADKDGKMTLAEFHQLRPPAASGGPGRPPSGAAPAARAGGRQRSRIGPPVSPGTYLAKLTIDGQEFFQEIRVEADPRYPAAMLTEELEEYEAKDRAKYIE